MPPNKKRNGSRSKKRKVLFNSRVRSFHELSPAKAQQRLLSLRSKNAPHLSGEKIEGALEIVNLNETKQNETQALFWQDQENGKQAYINLETIASGIETEVDTLATALNNWVSQPTKRNGQETGKARLSLTIDRGSKNGSISK